MHIPDGYLGPQTCAAAYGTALPFWVVSLRILNRTLAARQVPLLALGAAFSFVIMLFNVPVPGGTTGHAVGSVLVAVLMGPWAACIAISVALLIQALIFGDGGITAFGANCLTMSVIMPFSGYGIYRALAWKSALGSVRRAAAAAAGGYIGLNAAALVTAILLGIQPSIGGHDAAGRPLYAPYPLAAAVPVMASSHLLVFGFVEAAVTGLAFRYVQRLDPGLLQGAERTIRPEHEEGRTTEEA